MGIYNTFAYGTGVTYGSSTAAQFDASPFRAITTSFDTVDLSWSVPSGDYLALRVTRNQEGFSEHQEDGLVLFTDPFGDIRGKTQDTSTQYPLLGGKTAYYTIWLLMTDFSWRSIATASTLIPNPHPELAPDGTVLKESAVRFASLLPRTFLSSTGSALDEVDTTSDLFAFVNAMSLINDELYTTLENLAGKEPGVDSTEQQALVEALQYGFEVTSSLSMLTMKRLVRQAISGYSNKGSDESIASFSSAMTGYGTEVKLSPNLMLTPQDSTFYQAANSDGYIGNWVAGEVTTEITAIDIAEFPGQSITPSPSLYMGDLNWIGEITTASTTGTVTLGMDSPILNGVPVTPGHTYSLQMQAKAVDAASSINISIAYYDRLGNQVGTATPGVSQTLTLADTWYGLETHTLYIPQTVGELNSTSETALLPERIKFVGFTITATAPTSAGSVFNVDAIQFADIYDSRYATYYEARSIETYLYPNKINYVYNPSFETLDVDENIDGWGFEVLATQVSATNTEVYHGEFVAELDTSDTGGNPTVYTAPLAHTVTAHALPSNKFYVFSIYVRTTSGTTNTMTLGLKFQDSTISSSTELFTSDFVANDVWQRVWVRGFLPTEYTDTATAALSI